MATKITMPKLSDTMEEGIILKWIRKEGERVKQGEIIAEIQTDKADMELEAYDSGVLKRIVVQEGGRVPVGSLIAVIGEADEDISLLLEGISKPREMKVQKPQLPAGVVKQSMTPESAVEERTGGRIKASPLARRMAEDHRIDLASVHGSGPDGRITKEDVEVAVAAPVSTASAASGFVAVPRLEYEDVEPTLMRKTIAKRMHESKATVPHFYVTMEINMKNAIEFRGKLNELENTKVTFTDIIVKGAAIALVRHPKVNSAFLGEKIRLNRSVNIGVAVALDDGLVTPVISKLRGQEPATDSS